MCISSIMWLAFIAYEIRRMSGISFALLILCDELNSEAVRHTVKRILTSYD